MHRRQFLSSAALLAGSAAVAPRPVLAATARDEAPHAVPHLLAEFLALPGNKSAQVDVDEAAAPWRATFEADKPLFCGSCFKTFVLAAYLQEVEAGQLDEAEQLTLDDSVRSPSSPVFEHLSGTTQARNALEAMIAHSDNTATDMALRRVTPERVRRFIADAGLKDVRIPDSTRRFFSYVAGTPPGEDLSWGQITALFEAERPDASKYRPALNEVESMAVPASQFVAYYKHALAGGYFQKPETLTEFRRIQSLADAIAYVVPADTAAYMKGGSIDWNGFHCIASAGQMIVRGVPVTFALTLNWTDADGNAQDITARYIAAVRDVLGKVHKQLAAVPT